MAGGDGRSNNGIGVESTAGPSVKSERLSVTPEALSGKEVVELYDELRATYSGRNAEYQLARDRYAGIHWDANTNPQPAGRHALVFNYVRPTVDKAVEMLIGEMPGLQVMPPGTDEGARRQAEAEEALLYATWDVNDAPLVFRRVAFNQLLLRRGCLGYWWDSKLKRVRFRSIAPENFLPIYDGEDIAECLAVGRRLTRELQRMYPEQADSIRADNTSDAYFDDARWARTNGSSWDPLGLDHNTDRPPLTGTTLVIDWYDRHGNWVRCMGTEAFYSRKLGYETNRVPYFEFLGNVAGDEREPRGEIDDIVELNQYLDQLVSQQADVIKKWANPTVIDYGSGQDPVTVKRTLQGEGAVLPARRDAKVEYLNWSGTPPDVANQYQRVRDAISDLSGKPASAFGQTITNQSGVMTNMSLSPLVATNTTKQTLFAMTLTKLNEDILRLYEKFSKGEVIDVRGTKPRTPGTGVATYYEVSIAGAEIGGWYKNRIKWPSALRTDDPLYVQSELGKMTSQPPAQSVYTTLENLGIEDVEAELDRIHSQLEDPRMNPQGLETAVNAAQQLSSVPDLPPEMEGIDPGLQPGMGDAAGDMNMAAEGAGSPLRPELVAGARGY